MVCQYMTDWLCKVTHEDQNVLDFILPAFALLLILSHPQLSHCRPVLSIFVLGFSLNAPLSVNMQISVLSYHNTQGVGDYETVGAGGVLLKVRMGKKEPRYEDNKALQCVDACQK